MAFARLQRHEVEPLSPRSANIPIKTKSKKAAKEMAEIEEEDEARKAEAARRAAKEKEYAPAPPEWVIQPPSCPGALAEKFHTGRLLGKGGFAMAYEGEVQGRNQSSKGGIYALKVVRAKMSQKKMEDKFRTELQIHAKMRHPNIVGFHRAFTYKEATYVVLEMCSNGSVMDMVKKRRHLTLPEVRRLTVQLCGAIKYMHARSVIHRDLKMGNLFLDHDMNLKIGDFGLAAVLVSKNEIEGMLDYAKSRRTTLCGTPNYIAPEILEKGKGGHDHKVDIWAIGVILFAMIAGQPPFQSASQKEIYDRARNVDYTWPQENKHSNDIPDEAKDLVARLLKVDAERRPDPDQIVGHSFFSMYGGDAIPAKMEDYFREATPRFLDQKARPRGDVMVKGTERMSLRFLAKQCGVGYLPGALAPQAAVGADIDLSLYRECAAEEAAGLGPIVPLPDGIVYISKHSLGDWPNQPAKKVGFEPDVEFVKENIIPPRASQEITVQHSRKASGQRAPAKSYAATLRAAQAVGRAASSRIDPRLLDTERIPDIPQQHFAGSTRSRRGLLNELPLRPTNTSSAASSATSKAGQDAPVKETRTRATRSRKVINLDEDEKAAKAQPPPAMTKDEYIDATSPNPDEKRSKLAARTRARIASNIQREMSEESKPTKIPSFSSEPPRSSNNSSSTPSIQNLINPDEPYEQLPLSKPDDVLIGLRALHRNLSNHLNNIPSRKSRLTATEIEAKSKTTKHRPVVVKWVDYSNKFGIGYILANGTAGCVFKGSSTGDRIFHPTCIVVPGAENHLRQRKAGTPSYPEITQLVSLRGPAIEFVENCGLDGLKRVVIPASTYRTEPSDSGTEGRLGPGLDSYDHERRKKVCLWDKFGKYMTQTPSKEDPNNDDPLLDNPPSTSIKVTAPFITFYQRLGNTGIWAFSDTSLQFNFPDHTKIVISNAGEWIDFYHLPLAGAERIQRGQRLRAEDLADRSVLCYPTDILLKGEWRDHQKWGDVTVANELREKVAFVRDVVGRWIEHGGLGRMGAEAGEFGILKDGRPMMWEGMREVAGDKGKMVWVSVGARGGDGRFEMPAKEVGMAKKVTA